MPYTKEEEEIQKCLEAAQFEMMEEDDIKQAMEDAQTEIAREQNSPKMPFSGHHIVWKNKVNSTTKQDSNKRGPTPSVSSQMSLLRHPMERESKKRRHSSEEASTSKKARIGLPFTFEESYKKYNKRFKGQQTCFNLKFYDLPACNLGDVLGSLYLSLEQAIVQASSNFSDHALMRIVLHSSSLPHPISTKCLPKETMSAQHVITTVIETLQSCEELPLDHTLRLEIIVIERQKGEGKKGIKIINPENDGRLKRSIITINNEDSICMARAIVVLLAKLNNDPQYNSIRKPEKPIQRRKAEELHSAAGVAIGPCGVEEARQFENHLKIQINIVSLHGGNKIIYKGPEKDIKIFLWERKIGTKYHFDAITNMSAFLGYKNYCHPCDRGFDRITEHRCNDHCSSCGRDNCAIEENFTVCEDCHRKCRNAACLDLHKSTLACKKFWYCNSCHRQFLTKRRKEEQHVCGEYQCVSCKEWVFEGHLCFLKKKTLKKPKKNYIFFDFECTQHTGTHEPNFCVAQYTNGSEVIFSGQTTADDFGKWLFSRRHTGYTAIAHNAKGYDSVFLLNYLLSNGISPETVMDGKKIMCITHPNLELRVIDSLNFLPMALSKFPKTFGMDELKKGYFPHLFNKPENQDYCGPLPDIDFYSPKTMMPDARQKFLEWHQKKTEEKYIFDFKQEMQDYCRSDVDILRRACMRFQELFLQVAQCDPFQYLTIASVCMAVFRQHFIEKDTIAMVPVNGYNSKVKYSKTSIEWLDYKEKETGHTIQHALNSPSGEHKIGKYSVDGYCNITNTVYQFDGCLWHGCPTCFDSTMEHPITKQTMKYLLERTMKRDAFIRAKGYNLLTVWECEWTKMKKTEAKIQDFLKTHEMTSRLEPRDAFFGGRTNACQLYREAKEEETIKYIDFTSLYPYINKYCPYPVGHPEIITRDFEDISSYFGLVKCTILPPRRLYHPVLPYRSNGKLFFPLCKTCATNLEQESCCHSDKERELEGTWVTEEVKKAIEKGYKIQKIHEVYHFKETSTGLFKKYVDTFLKLKQEASGWPSHCKTETEKEDYIQKYEEHENIKLEKQKIEVNPGLRALAKLCLNSFWGRFGMNENKKQTVFCRSNIEVNRLMSDNNIEITSFNFVNEDVLEMTYEHAKAFQPQKDATNIFIAAFTTAHARLKLYNALDKLGNSVLYYDTDSIIYVSKGNNDPPIGDYLGDFTDELNGQCITTFVSGGPKNYAYKCSDNKEVVKVRGFTLNYGNSLKINYEAVDSLVKDYVTTKGDNKVAVQNTKFWRNGEKKTIENRLEIKRYGIVYTKRVIQPDYNTLPYGF